MNILDQDQSQILSSLIQFETFVKFKKSFVWIKEIKLANENVFHPCLYYLIEPFHSGGFSHFICLGVAYKNSSGSSLFAKWPAKGYLSFYHIYGK